MWNIYPAIDLRQGRVVRLRRGDPDQETEYATDPRRIARRWREAGAHWVHVVNLDGAFGEQSAKNQAALRQILQEGLQVQFGGGLRDVAAVERALDLGVRRVVIGTAAVKTPEVLQRALEQFDPERVAISIDARGGRVSTDGWQQVADISALEFAQHWEAKGVQWAVYTDVARDGMREGLNLEATVALSEATGLKVIASGGVASLEDVRQAQVAGLAGVIIGKALYEGDVDLEAALAVDGS